MVVVIDLIRFERERHSHLSIATIRGTGSQDSHYRVRTSVHSYLFADDVGVCSEMSTPQTMREDYNPIVARLTFFRNEIASQEHRRSQHVIKARGPSRSLHLFGTIVSSEIE